MVKQITNVPQLPPRKPDAHKGHFGRVLVIGGCRGMVGAPALSASAALRSGAGLVRVAVPVGIQQSVAVLTPCATTIALAEDKTGSISKAALPVILKALADTDGIAIGPGMGISGGAKAVIETVIREFTGPTVVDADGLNNLAKLGGIKLNNHTILTPHPGEMKRLWKCYYREDMPAERHQQAETLANKTGAVIILKGQATVVTTGTKTYLNTTGNPGMATGGSGDVLTGMIAALTARQDSGMDVFDCAVKAVYEHGRAADLAARALSQTGMIATDLLEFLGKVWEV